MTGCTLLVFGSVLILVCLRISWNTITSGSIEDMKNTHEIVQEKLE